MTIWTRPGNGPLPTNPGYCGWATAKPAGIGAGPTACGDGTTCGPAELNSWVGGVGVAGGFQTILVPVDKVAGFATVVILRVGEKEPARPPGAEDESRSQTGGPASERASGVRAARSAGKEPANSGIKRAAALTPLEQTDRSRRVRHAVWEMKPPRAIPAAGTVQRESQ